MTARNLLREDESFQTARSLRFAGGVVELASAPASHDGPTPTTRLTSQELVAMAREALDRATNGTSGDPRRSAAFALDCLIDAVERWP